MAGEVLMWPCALDPSGRLATVRQGTRLEAFQRIGMWLGTEVGERPMLPGYGVSDGAELSSSMVTASLSLWEPDLRVLGVEVTSNGVDAVTVDVEVETDGDD